MQNESVAIKILGKNIPEILLEVIIVVFGILIAFLLDNWWDGVLESKEHKDILYSLEQEFLENRRLIREEKIWIEKAKESSLKLLLLDPNNITEEHSKRVDSFLYAILGIPSFQPDNIEVQDIINSGKIKYLENPGLEKLISKWEAEMKKKNDLESEAAERTEHTEINYLFDKISFIRLDKQFSPIREKLASVVDYGHDYEVLKERKFRNFVDDQLFHFDQYEEKLTVIDSVITEILEVIKG